MDDPCDGNVQPVCSAEPEWSTDDTSPCPVAESPPPDATEPVGGTDVIDASAEQPLDVDEPVTDEPRDADYKPVCNTELESNDVPCAYQSVGADDQVAHDASHQTVCSTDLLSVDDVSSCTADVDEPVTAEQCDADYESVCCAEPQSTSDVTDSDPFATTEPPLGADNPVTVEPCDVYSTELLQSADDVSLYATADQPEDCDGVVAVSDALGTSNGETEVITRDTHDFVAVCGESDGAGDTRQDREKLMTDEDASHAEELHVAAGDDEMKADM